MAAAALLVAALAWIYGRIAWGLAAEWVSSADASYGIILAAVAAAVFWRRRHLFVASIDRSDRRTWPFVLLLSGAALFAIGQLGADLFLTRMSLVIVAGGAIGFVAGARALESVAAGVAFLALAIPLPSILVNAITLPLQLVASRIAEWALVLVNVPVYRDGNVLALPS